MFFCLSCICVFSRLLFFLECIFLPLTQKENTFLNTIWVTKENVLCLSGEGGVHPFPHPTTPLDSPVFNRCLLNTAELA